MTDRHPAVDVAIVGGGIMGCAAAAYLAEGGASVALYEREAVAAGASGRNSGSIQHPFDEHLAALYRRSLELYRRLSNEGTEFQLPAEPAGLLLVDRDPAAVSSAATDLARHTDLSPTLLDSAEVARLEPLLAPGLSACRLETGYQVAPASATRAFAQLATRRGASLVMAAARPWIEAARVRGLELSTGERVAAGEVIIAAGPWSAEMVPGWRSNPPIRALWGVVVTTHLEAPPVHVLEELGVDQPVQPALAFSLISAGGTTGVGSTFLDERPDPAAYVARLMARGAAFVPTLRDAPIDSVRMCARPLSFDSRPFIGRLPGMAGLWICAGHGPWGISTGPASAELVVQRILGQPSANEPIDSAFAPGRTRVPRPDA